MFDGDRMRFGFAASVIGLITAVPTLRWGENSPWTYVLFAITSAVIVQRTLPADRLPLQAAVAVEAIGAVASGALFALQPNPGIGMLLYVSAVYFGARFPQRIAIALAVLLGGTVAAGLGLQRSTDFWIGLSVTVAVWAGIVRRTRRERTQALEQLVEQTQRTAASEARSSALAERARIARDLHDVLAHTLSGAGMQLELADALLEAGRPEDARTAVQRARGAIAGGVTEARDAVHALREDIIDLPAALAALADGENETVSADPVDIDDAAGRAVLRVAQEAFTNARRHAPGAAVTASLSAQPDGVRLTVANGPGRTAEATHGSGMGLIGMRERAAEVDGVLHAGPAADGGWTVTLTVPERSPVQ
ncbi:sensor histidine kinase [Tsukamurella paurometabola]|uniref:histidine kinase n=1 Tax=Tsukamurella paurometabola (strain ATCC 8368 / DSM 20162 / CCUG 35730 / CIP 100753 / JCM 10117 / KCTC 9821 / NBRC 16120 / NCIMB 702349 / NCTC 13040) TaxID=521096 RepID=D5UNN4_TSUPD|nr:histidine kinase [Tsukamurella paurometabola]ADG78602.1 integral membrane sensor signal transduction histidine kinase [Tsukamurella paurometabola DSM 20162]